MTATQPVHKTARRKKGRIEIEGCGIWVGLYPALVYRSPWLTRVGAISASLGAVGFAINLLVSLGQLTGVMADEIPVWLRSHVLLLIVGFVVGYLAFGIASLRTDRYPRSLGLILVVPAILYVLLLLVEIAQGFSQWLFIITAGDAVAMLAIGYQLRTEMAQNESLITADDIV